MSYLPLTEICGATFDEKIRKFSGNSGKTGRKLGKSRELVGRVKQEGGVVLQKGTRGGCIFRKLSPVAGRALVLLHILGNSISLEL